MMRPLRRGGSLVGALVMLSVLTACSQSPRDQLNSELADREDKLPSCAADGCVDEVTELVAALSKLPGVVRITEARYHPEQITDGASVGGWITVKTGSECDTLRERAAELGWKSSVSPLMGISFQCRLEGHEFNPQGSNYLSTEVRPPTRKQLEEWGDRGSLKAP